MRFPWERISFDFIKFFKIDRNALKRKRGTSFYLWLGVIILVLIVASYGVLYLNYKLSGGVKALKVEPGKKAVRISKPKIAIIIDDAGGKGIDYDLMFSISQPITIAILPGLPETETTAVKALVGGKEVMLHLSMEPHDSGYRREDGRMILTGMTDKDIKSIVKRSIKGVFGAVGVNNHMGSKATEDKRVMKAVLEEIKANDLFFVDSGTSRNSIGYSLARKMRMPTAHNNVFLDTDGTKEGVINKLKILVAEAKKRKSAIGIAHATRRETLEALIEELPKYEEVGIEFVAASEVVK